MGHVTKTTLLSGVVCHPRLGLAMIKLSTTFEVSNSTRYEDRKIFGVRKLYRRATVGVVSVILRLAFLVEH